MAATSETLRILAALDAADLARARQQVRDIASAYVLAWDEVSGDLAAALDDLAAARAAGEAPQALVLRSTRLRKALSVIADKLHELADTGALRITRDLRQAVQDAGAGQVALITSTLPAGHAGMAVAWDAANADAIAAIVERATQQIHAAHLPLSDEAIAAMRSELIRGLAAGSNPKATALRMLARCEGHFNGGIARAMRISRTETLDAMRAASRLADLSNPDLVTGWQWVASLTPRTCFPAGTLIRTTRGNVPIESVRECDMVMTHTGQFRRAYGLMSRDYRGDMVTITADDLIVTSTSDHPFLIEREGELQWMEASGIRHGDRVLSDRKRSLNCVDHGLSKRSVEGRGHQAHDGKSAALEEQVLAGVAVLDSSMPIRLVDLNRNHLVGDDEVDRPLPPGHGALLDEIYPERIQTSANVSLGLSLAGVLAVAANRAESGSTRRDDSDSLATGEAGDHHRGSAAFFRAKGQPSTVRWKYSAASLARRVFNMGARALNRAVDLVGCASWNFEGTLTACTNLLNLNSREVAVPGAMLPGPGRTRKKFFPAGRTNPLDSGAGYLSPRGVRIRPLVGGVAVAGAELAGRPLSDPRRRDLELAGAVLTSPLHRHIVSSVATHYQATRVFNFEVEVDHSYIADGVAAHNCPACFSMHGSIHPADEPGPLDHHQGRCARVPLTRSWRDLGFDVDEPPSVIPDAQATFDAMGRDARRQVLGGKGLAAYEQGRFPMSAWSVRKDTPEWRPAYYAAKPPSLTPRRAVA